MCLRATTGVAVSKPNATQIWRSPDSWLTFQFLFRCRGPLLRFRALCISLLPAGLQIFRGRLGTGFRIGRCRKRCRCGRFDSIRLQSRTLLAMTPAGIVSVVGDTLRDKYHGSGRDAQSRACRLSCGKRHRRVEGYSSTMGNDAPQRSRIKPIFHQWWSTMTACCGVHPHAPMEPDFYAYEW